MDWQPIETAPKDGTVVDVWIDSSRYSDCWFGRPTHMCGEAGKYCDCCPTYDGWCDIFGYLTGEDGRKTESPSHWMPLPPPPRS